MIFNELSNAVFRIALQYVGAEIDHAGVQGDHAGVQHQEGSAGTPVLDSTTPWCSPGFVAVL